MNEQGVNDFHEAATKKHRRGCDEHRDGDYSKPFKGDLRTEYEEEQLDSYNYLSEMAATGVITMDEFQYAATKHMEFWIWMRENVRGRR